MHGAESGKGSLLLQDVRPLRTDSVTLHLGVASPGGFSELHRPVSAEASYVAVATPCPCG